MMRSWLGFCAVLALSIQNGQADETPPKFGNYNCGVAAVARVRFGTSRAYIEQKDELKLSQPTIIEIRPRFSDDMWCIRGMNYGPIVDSYCRAPYQATIRKADGTIEMYGDNTEEFRGFSVVNALSISRQAYFLTYHLDNELYTATGECRFSKQ
jgi:hypothetical protein